MTNARNNQPPNDSIKDDASTPQDAELQEGLDYHIENGLLVFTAAFLIKRGYCCESGCRHCPYHEEQSCARR